MEFESDSGRQDGGGMQRRAGTIPSGCVQNRTAGTCITFAKARTTQTLETGMATMLRGWERGDGDSAGALGRPGQSGASDK